MLLEVSSEFLNNNNFCAFSAQKQFHFSFYDEFYLCWSFCMEIDRINMYIILFWICKWRDFHFTRSVATDSKVISVMYTFRSQKGIRNKFKVSDPETGSWSSYHRKKCFATFIVRQSTYKPDVGRANTVRFYTTDTVFNNYYYQYHFQPFDIQRHIFFTLYKISHSSTNIYSMP